MPERATLKNAGKGYWDTSHKNFRVIVIQVEATIIDTFTAKGGERFSPNDVLKEGDTYTELIFDDSPLHYYVPTKDLGA